jgi:hypothetical protein
LSMISAAVLIACGKKSMPVSEANEKGKTSVKAGTRSDENPASTAKTPSVNATKNTDADLDSKPRSTDIFSNTASLEQGKSIYLSNCGKCHTLYNVHDFSSDRWKEILKKEIPRANLSQAEGEQVYVFIFAKTKK